MGTGGNGGGAGRRPGRSRKPASSPHNLACRSAVSRWLPAPTGPSARRCLLDGAHSPNCPTLGRSQALFGVVPSALLPPPSPGHAVSTPGEMLLPYATGAELAPGEKEKAALVVEETSALNGTSACGDTVHSVPMAPAGVLAAPAGHSFVHKSRTYLHCCPHGSRRCPSAPQGSTAA